MVQMGCLTGPGGRAGRCIRARFSRDTRGIWATAQGDGGPRALSGPEAGTLGNLLTGCLGQMTEGKAVRKRMRDHPGEALGLRDNEKALAQEVRTCPRGPSGTLTLTGGVTGPPGTPTPTAGVTGPSGTPTSTGGVTGPPGSPTSTAGVTGPSGPPHLLEGFQDPACKTSWDPFPMTLGLRE